MHIIHAYETFAETSSLPRITLRSTIITVDPKIWSHLKNLSKNKTIEIPGKTKRFIFMYLNVLQDIPM